MIVFVLVTHLVLQTPGEGQGATAALGGPSSVAFARAHPDTIRAHLLGLFSRAANASPTEAEHDLADADSLAQSYAIAWADPYLVRRVERFRSWSPAERRVKVTADSLRLAGNAAFDSEGAPVAMRLWRRSATLCNEIGDSAGVAMAWGNIGRGFYMQDALDSASAYYARSLDYAERLGDFRTSGNAVLALGSISNARGDLRRAMELLGRAESLEARTGDDRGAAARMNDRGNLAQSLGDIPAAREAYTRALLANRRAGRRGPAATNLINLGNLAALTGDLDSAASCYHMALELYRLERDRPNEAEVLHDLGLLALRGGDYRVAVIRLADALTIYRVTGLGSSAAAVQRDLADARAAMGDLQGALRELEGADAGNAAGVSPSRALRASLILARADLNVQFNRLDDAARDYSRAEGLYRQTGDLTGQAAAQQGRGFMLLLKEDYPSAVEILQVALRLHEESGDHRAAALARVSLAYAQSELGDTASARRTLGVALDSLEGAGDEVGAAAALRGLGDLTASEGRAVAAESLYRQGLARLGNRPAPEVSWPLRAGLGQTLAGRGEWEAAAKAFLDAARDIEGVASRVSVEPLRISYLADKTEVYSQLARVERAAGHGDLAFGASERLRAREMLDLLGRGRIVFDSTAGDSLAARAQALRLRINDLTSQLEAGPEAPVGLREQDASAQSAVTREALSQAQDAYAELLLRLEESNDRPGALVGGRIAALGEVMRGLRPDEALLEYLVADSTTLVFVVTADTATAIDLGVGRHVLATLVDFTRSALGPSMLHQHDPLWRTPLRRLYQNLIAPIEGAGLLNGKRTVFIVPHAELHYLPFAALIAPGPPERYLIERYTIETVPSASVWLRLRDRRPNAEPEQVLALAPRLDALPASRTEMEAIQQAYGSRATVLMGSRASEVAFRAGVEQASIVHLATFGVLNKHNPLFSFVELAPHGTDDGHLEVHEVFGLRLHARLVVLSACQTAIGSGALADVPPGDDWVGLVQAFLYAGAGKVMATLWPVEDRATAQLMGRFYKDMAGGMGEAEALAQAQRGALRNSETAEPFYWAGFTLSGGR